MDAKKRIFGKAKDAETAKNKKGSTDCIPYYKPVTDSRLTIWLYRFVGALGKIPQCTIVGNMRYQKRWETLII